MLSRLSDLLVQSRRIESELIAHIGEVDERKLYARRACSSMFSFCVEILNLSEAEAYLRIAVARASRKHPVLFEMLADGRLHLSGIALLAPHLTESNRDAVLARAAHRSKREIEELVAELAPKPDAPSTIRKLPSPPQNDRPAPDQLRPERVDPPSELRPDGVTMSGSPPQPKPEKPTEATASLPPKASSEVKPLAPERYRATFTTSAEFRDKLRRLQALMRSSTSDGDLAAVIEESVTEKLERLEAARFAQTKAPRKDLQETDTTPSSRYIPAAVRRAVRKRDGARCAFEDAQGKRCTESNRLEFHHNNPFGRGGDHSLDNVRLLCRVHNAFLAEQDYGKHVMQKHRGSGDRVSESAPVYFAHFAISSRSPPSLCFSVHPGARALTSGIRL
ncbi:MAG TPA: hypothetical protein VEK15_05335 [Vicinamibacteria bacterium]|nr:hypothetical protein [Vicinamibacteria bacterium]